MSKIISDLKKKYQSRLTKAECPRKLDDFNPTIYLFHKWSHKVPKGWYGFDLSNVPYVWGMIIDGFLEYIDKETSGEFEIHQIKLKMGGLRFYVGGVSNMGLRKDIEELEDWLSDSRLIY